MNGLLAQPLVLMIAGWTSGISIYLTVALLGISGRMGWIELPGDLNTLSHILVIIVALAVFAIEFVADKVPYVDSIWDSVHTFIRPLGAAGLGVLAGVDQGPIAQTLYAVLTGTIALDMHAVKATSRLAINTSPEPFSNIAASFTENASVIFIFWFFIKHPIWACILILTFLVLSFLFLRMMWRFARKLFRRAPIEKAVKPVSAAILIMFMLSHPTMVMAENGTKNGLLPDEIISMEGLLHKVKEGDTFLLFDARSKKSYRESHIEGARLPLTDEYYRQEDLFKDGLIKSPPDRAAALKEAMATIPKDTTIVTYCNTGCHASAVLVLQLKQLGYGKVQAFEDGFQSWEQKGYPVVRAQPAK